MHQEKVDQSIENVYQDKNDQSPGNILVVDDNPQNLRLLIAILSMQEYKVRPAPTGVIALESALSTPPDIILLDIMMPEMDGYEVCRKLKEHSLTRSIPVIFISAIDGIADKVKAFEMGAVDYITKPFQAEEILARVNTHVSLRKTQKLLEDEIERRKASENELQAISLKYKQIASQDYLTGISNRRCFMEQAEEEINRSQRYRRPVTFLMMDIDHFKKINDTYGHRAGDMILKNVATTCRDALRANDLFGRIGGEEFSALLPETTLGEALNVAERIRKSIEESQWKVDNFPVSCTISIGMSQLKSSDMSQSTDRRLAVKYNVSQAFDRLMKEADDALYLAKSSGRNCIC